ncbi:MAG: DEAD/DEAH box helicase [Thermococci archaeon]|nr:DEAD/DEAH box helicase [Thermococci archaeon]
MKVDDLPVSEKVRDVIKGRGIDTLYPPQAEALKSGVLKGRNLLLSIPTASGKTLVAEIVMADKLLREGGKAVYLVPLKALAEEKYREFRDWERIGLRVAATTGDYDSRDEWLSRYDIIVATSEKFDSLLRHNPRWVKDVGLIVADEVHLIGSQNRGATLEMILSLMKDRAQIIALSATVGNARELAEWLDAELVVSDWRPVPLRKGVFHDGRVMWDDGSCESFGRDWRNLAVDAVRRGKQALVFVNSRRSAEKEAVEISKLTGRLLSRSERDELAKLADAMESNPTNERLKLAIKGGVAFHHAGLTHEERRLIEDAFKDGVLKVITATPTLAAGVNVPAFRVVIRDVKRYSGFGWTDIPVLEIQQMMGRAGRPRYDVTGEAVIVVKVGSPEDVMERYVRSEPERLFSMLAGENTFRSLILALIVSFGVRNFDELIGFLEKTFYFHQRKDTMTIESNARRLIGFFIENEFIDMESDGTFQPSPLGRRTAQLYIDPLSAKRFSEVVESIDENPNPFGILHTIAATPDMTTVPIRKREMEDYLDLAYELEEDLYFEVPWEDYRMRSFLSQVKTAKILLDWMNEVPEVRIYETYSIEPGDFRRILETADWLLYSLLEIYRLYSDSQIDYLRALHIRLKKGVREELLDLVQLPGIGRKRARALYNAGFRSLEDVASASVADLLKVEGIGLKIAEDIRKVASKGTRMGTAG